MDIILLFLAKPLDKHGTTLVHITYPPLEDQISEEKIFWLSALNLKDIPYNGISCETLDRLHVKYVLPKYAFMPKTVVTFAKKVGLISAIMWLEGFSYSGHKCNCWLKIVNH